MCTLHSAPEHYFALESRVAWTELHAQLPPPTRVQKGQANLPGSLHSGGGEGGGCFIPVALQSTSIATCLVSGTGGRTEIYDWRAKTDKEKKNRLLFNPY